MGKDVSERFYQLVKMDARKASRKEIFKEIFGLDIDNITERQKNNIDSQICRWRKRDDYHAEWLKAFKNQWSDILADAVNVVQEGLHDDSLPWRRTQHANLALAYGTKILVGEEERTMTVKVEGLPDIGSPDN